MSLFLASYNMHAVSHSFTHRGPTASRARSRWQPYSASAPLSAVPAPSRSSPPNVVYLNSPASSVSSLSPASSSSSSSSSSLHPLSDTPDHAIRRSSLSQPSASAFSSSSASASALLRETQKAKYVTRLVGQSHIFLLFQSRKRGLPSRTSTFSFSCFAL